MKKFRICFAGTPTFAAAHLQALLKAGHHVVAVYTQPDRPAGRGKKLQASPVKQIALEHKLAVFQPSSLRPPQETEALVSLDCDLMIVVAYGLILPKTILDAPNLGCLNVHASLLPKWRGAAPIQRSIMNLDTETGISMMQIVEELDSGPVIEQFKVKIKNTSTSGEISEHLSKIGSENIVNTLNSIFNKKLIFSEQNHRLATYAKKKNLVEMKEINPKSD